MALCFFVPATGDCIKLNLIGSYFHALRQKSGGTESKKKKKKKKKEAVEQINTFIFAP
jgi:hypothetical protein